MSDSSISFTHYGITYSVYGINREASASELKEIFSKILVQAGFQPNVIELAEGGHYECEYKDD